MTTKQHSQTQPTSAHTNPTTSLNSISLQIHPSPIISRTFHKTLIFESLLIIYYYMMILTTMSTSNIRIIIYCILFVTEQYIKIVNSMMDYIDPLGIGAVRRFLSYMSWFLKCNMLYQLCILTYVNLQHHKSLPVFIMFVHFAVVMLKVHRPDPTSYSTNTGSSSTVGIKRRQLFKIMDFVNPILLYSFLKQFDNEQSQMSIIFVVFLSANLLLTSQIRLILNSHESDFIGWVCVKINNHYVGANATNFNSNNPNNGSDNNSKSGSNSNINNINSMSTNSTNTNSNNINSKQTQNQPKASQTSRQQKGIKAQELQSQPTAQPLGIQTQQAGSSISVWSRAHALKLLVISCCIMLVVENFLLIFQSIKNQICLNILHTLIIGILAYLLGINATDLYHYSSNSIHPKSSHSSSNNRKNIISF